MHGRGIVRKLGALVPLNLRRRCWTSLLMVSYIVYSILVTSSVVLCGQNLNWVIGSEFDPVFGIGRVMEHLHLLTLSFTVDEELWRYNCMRWCFLWGFGYRSFWRWNHEKSFFMVKGCKDLEHLWCASWRSVQRGICRWLRSWLACIAELAGNFRLDENQFDLGTFLEVFWFCH